MNNHEEFTRTGYDRVAREYASRLFDELREKPLDRALLASFAEQVPDGLPVADVGCGPGHVTRHLHERDLDVIGIDLSPEMIQVARERMPQASFEVGSMLSLDADDNAWGGIVAFYSVIHLDDDEVPRALAEFTRVLVPGGLLLLAFHVTPPAQMELNDGVVHIDDWMGESVSLDFHFREPVAMTKQLERVGFVVEASVERLPYPDEAPTRRAYLLARSWLENEGPA